MLRLSLRPKRKTVAIKGKSRNRIMVIIDNYQCKMLSAMMN